MQEPANNSVLQCRELGFSYPGVAAAPAVLRGIDLVLLAGQQVAITGESGSGKSTLLHLAAGLERPTSGTIYLESQNLDTLTETQRTRLRQQRVGIVFQAFHLIPTLTARENILLPLELAGRTSRLEMDALAREQLEAVGLAHKADYFPEQLSGGEQQRIAIARAVVHQPALILADEPTGNLDSRTGETVFQLLMEQVARTGAALLLVTHSLPLAQRMDRWLQMVDGQLLVESTI